MVSNARDLYERLIVLRHKAYEQEVNGSMTGDVQSPSVEIELPTFTLDLSEIPSDTIETELPSDLNPVVNENVTDQRQVNLMDMIEEVTKTGPTENTSTIEPAEDNAVDISFPEPTPIVSLNDILSQNQNTSTILNRLEKSKIDDLKKSITMNQRFQFSRELFSGDSEQYEITISALNNCDSEKALELFQTYKQKWSWDETTIAFIELLDLVQRRHEI